jgi:hypothetical protein
MKVLLILLISFISQAWAESTPPDNCFKWRSYCIQTKVTKLDHREVILLEAFALKKVSPLDLARDYLDFDTWEKRLGRSEQIRYDHSSLVGGDLKTEWVHLSSYSMKGPLRLRFDVKELTSYRLMRQEGEDLYFSFELLDYDDQEGVNFKKGEIHLIKQDSGKVLVTFIMYVQPSISIGMGLSKKYIQKGIKEVLVKILDI